MLHYDTRLECNLNAFLCLFKQMANYSPISSRSTRNLTHAIRRRDSLNSSIGATSVRRLIAVVRNTSGRYGPVYNRRFLIRNLVVLCVSHTLMVSAFLPFLSLQGSVSVWILPLHSDVLPVNVNVGSMLLMFLYLTSSVSVVLAPSLVQRIGANGVIVAHHLILAAFFALHFYPLLYVLIPGYFLLGSVLGPVLIARMTYVMTLSKKLGYVFTEDDEDSKILRRACVVRRVSRAFRTAHDFGLILGSILSAFVISYTFSAGETRSVGFEGSSVRDANATTADGFQVEANATAPNGNCTNCSCTSLPGDVAELHRSDYDAFLDLIFDVDEFGERLCGSHACPNRVPLPVNVSDELLAVRVLPRAAARILIGVYVVLCVAAAICTVFGLDKVKRFVHQDPLERSDGMAAARAVKESFRDVRLELAAPLAFFIGLEQSFMYTDFGKVRPRRYLTIHTFFIGTQSQNIACVPRSRFRYYC